MVDKIRNRNNIEDEDLFVAAIRPPQQTSLQRLLASQIALANLAERPLMKIRYVLEGFFLLPPEMQKEIAGEEISLYERLYKVCLALLNPYVRRDYWGNEYVRIEWPFSDIEAPIFFHPWLRDYTIYLEIPKRSAEHLKEMREKAKAVIEQAYKIYKDTEMDIAFYIRTYYETRFCHIMSWAGYYSIVNQFVCYAMPLVMKLANKLLGLTDPELFDSYLAALGGGRVKGREEV